MNESRTTWVSTDADGELNIIDAGINAANERLMRLVNLERQATRIGFSELADELQEVIDEMQAGEWLDALPAVDQMISSANHALGEHYGQHELRVATPGWLRGEAKRRAGEPFRPILAPVARSIAPERPDNASVPWFSERMADVLNDPYDLEVDEDVREEALKALAQLPNGEFKAGNIRSYYYGMSLTEMLEADGKPYVDETE